MCKYGAHQTNEETTQRKVRNHAALLHFAQLSEAALVMHRLLVPATSHFSMSPPAFPQEAGHLRPGLACTFRITFQPDALRDYEDQIVVERQGAAGFSIPLSAGYQVPRLTLPPSLDLGPVFLGAARGRQVYVRNVGGPGAFRWEPQTVAAGASGNGSGASKIPAAPGRHGISHRQRPVQVIACSPSTYHMLQLRQHCQHWQHSTLTDLSKSRHFAVT